MRTLVLTSRAYRCCSQTAVHLAQKMVNDSGAQKFLFVDLGTIEKLKSQKGGVAPEDSPALKRVDLPCWIMRQAQRPSGKVVIDAQRMESDLDACEQGSPDDFWLMEGSALDAEEYQAAGKALRRSMFGRSRWPRAILWVVNDADADLLAKFLFSVNSVQPAPMSAVQKKRLIRRMIHRSHLISIFGNKTGLIQRYERIIYPLLDRRLAVDDR